MSLARVSAQNPDVVAAITPLTAFTKIMMDSQVGHFAQSMTKYVMMVENAISTAKSAADHYQAAMRMEEMALKNLKSAENIKSFGDAQNWVNHQLDLERQASEAARQTQVSIGAYFTSVVDIAELLKSPDRFKVSEGERSQIYQRMGISPANYAYLRTWNGIEQQMLEKSIGIVEAFKEKRKKDAAARAELAEKYQNSGEEGITDNALARDANALQIQSIEVQEDIRDGIADLNKRAAIEDMKRQQVPEKARVSETYGMSLGKSPVDVTVEELDD
jgi:hypothetical protein